MMLVMLMMMMRMMKMKRREWIAPEVIVYVCCGKGMLCEP